MKKFDEIHEGAGAQLVELMSQYKDDDLDLSQRLNSPRHPEVVMIRHYFSPKRQIEIDECPQCGGIWLDVGELAQIRELFPTEEDRKQAGKEFAKEVLNSPGIREMLNASEEQKQKFQRIGNIMRLLSPSSYMPLKHDLEDL